jgi:membrane protein YdbS with pleckstrin-like domain
MSRAAELFAIGSTILLLAGLLLPFPFGLTVTLGGTVFVMPGRASCFIVAALLCFFAAIYSLWVLPMNHAAAQWHFWITAVSIAGGISSGLIVYRTLLIPNRLDSVILFLGPLPGAFFYSIRLGPRCIPVQLRAGNFSAVQDRLCSRLS